MLSCFKITANRFKNSYKLVIIDSPWLPIILNFSLYAIIQDLTPYTTERNKYHFIYHNSFRYGFLIKLIDGLSSAKIHRFSLFLEYASSTFRSEKPDCYLQRNDIQAGKFLHLSTNKDFSLVNLAAKSSQSNCYQHHLNDMDNYIDNTKLSE